MTEIHPDLGKIKFLLIDIDGVLCYGDTPVPGSVEFFSTLRSNNLSFVLVTNNATKNPHEFVDKFNRMGVAISPDEVLNSAQAAAEHLSEHSPEGGKVFIIGETGLVDALEKKGFAIAGLYEINAQFVVCGMDRKLTWDKLATATLNINSGAYFIGTNPDPSFPSEFGLVHGNGAILAALTTATGVDPFIVGKPNTFMYMEAMKRMGANPETTLAVGDRIETDILSAVRSGVKSVLLLSGVTIREQLMDLDFRPTWVMNDLIELTRALKNRKI